MSLNLAAAASPSQGEQGERRGLVWMLRVGIFICDRNSRTARDARLTSIAAESCDCAGILTAVGTAAAEAHQKCCGCE